VETQINSKRITTIDKIFACVDIAGIVVWSYWICTGSDRSGTAIAILTLFSIAIVFFCLKVLMVKRDGRKTK